MLRKIGIALVRIYENTTCQFILRLFLGVLIVFSSGFVIGYGKMVYKQNGNVDVLAFWHNIAAGVAFLGFSVMFGSIKWVDSQKKQKQRDETITTIKSQNDQLLQQLSAQQATLTQLSELLAAQAAKAQTPAINNSNTPDQALVESYVPLSNI